jgi:hypothetical protein
VPPGAVPVLVPKGAAAAPPYRAAAANLRVWRTPSRARLAEVVRGM